MRRGKLAGSFLVAAGVVAFGAAILWQSGYLKPLMLFGAARAPEKHAYGEQKVLIKPAAPAVGQRGEPVHKGEGTPPLPLLEENNRAYSQERHWIETASIKGAAAGVSERETRQQQLPTGEAQPEPENRLVGETELLAVLDEAWQFQSVLERIPALEAAEGTVAVVQEERGGAKKIKDSAQRDASLQPANGAFPYSLYLGSASAQFPERAREGMAQYRRKGIEPYWVEVELSKRAWYRIYTGSFSSREEAEALKESKDLKKAEIREVPYANLVGVYGSAKEARDQIEALRNEQFWPYLVEAPPGTYRVFVGAFHGEERVRRQQARLTAEGIESEIVRR